MYANTAGKGRPKSKFQTRAFYTAVYYFISFAVGPSLNVPASLSQSVLENSKNGLDPAGESRVMRALCPEGLDLRGGGGHRRDSKSPPD